MSFGCEAWRWRNRFASRSPEKRSSFPLADPKGNVIFRKRDVTSRFGIAAIDCPLATEINEGAYQIQSKVGDTIQRDDRSRSKNTCCRNSRSMSISIVRITNRGKRSAGRFPPDISLASPFGMAKSKSTSPQPFSPRISFAHLHGSHRRIRNRQIRIRAAGHTRLGGRRILAKCAFRSARRRSATPPDKSSRPTFRVSSPTSRSTSKWSRNRASWFRVLSNTILFSGVLCRTDVPRLPARIVIAGIDREISIRRFRVRVDRIHSRN